MAWLLVIGGSLYMLSLVVSFGLEELRERLEHD